MTNRVRQPGLNVLLTPRYALLITAAVLLAAEPLVWLAGTWVLPGYSGLGWLPAAVTAGLFLWSISSAGPRPRGAFDEGVLLLTLSALLRLVSQVLAINIVGALLLCVDVYALARVAGLERRARALSPFWLAVCFAFALPLEPMLQRIFGYGLQLLSAHAAYVMLWPFTESLTVSGTRLVLAGRDVFVDLPCSGAQLLSLLGFGYAALNAVARPTPASALKGCIVALAAGVVANGLRVATLSLGIAHEETLGFSVMHDPAHEIVGLLFTGLAFTVLLAMSSASHRREGPARARRPRPFLPRTLHSPAACALLVFALTVGALQPRPLDASLPLAPSEAPRVAADFLAEPLPLSAAEAHYFTRFGGGASHNQYGPFGLLVVETTSPLRHLHDPAVCMRAAGATVELVGTDHATATTVYRTTSSGGETHMLRVSYRSASGRVATSIAEVVWHWLRAPERWTMVQRIAPAELDAPDTGFELAMRRAFNLFPSVPTQPSRLETPS